MTRQLPARPDLEHLRKQAKHVLERLKSGDPVAHERYRALLTTPAPAAPRLADAQRAVAREYGFASWNRLKAHVDAVVAGADPAAELVAAIHSGDVAAARRTLERHPALRSRLDDTLPGLSFGATPLLAAVATGRRELVDLLLDAGADVNQRSHWWAGGFGVLDDGGPLTGHLIARGARVDVHAAARLGRMDRLEALVAADPALVHARGGDGQTPLHVAANAAMAAWLLDHGAAIDARDVDHESTAAQYAVRDRQDVARLLVERGCETDLLMLAALGDLARVRALLAADPEAIRIAVEERWFPKRDFHSGGTIYLWKLGAHKTAHVVAREFGHEEVFRLLLEHTPEPQQLALACELGDEPLFRRLLAARPDLPRTLDDDDRRKLVAAAESNNTSAVRLMLEAGWPVDARGPRQDTALHWAGFHGNADMTRRLLAAGANLESRDRDYDGTPFGWACHGSRHGWHRTTGDYAATVAALLDAGAPAPAADAELDVSDAVREVLERRAAG